jgi:hypothetical protein
MPVMTKFLSHPAAAGWIESGKNRQQRKLS